MEKTPADLDCLFNPRNVAVIGASKNIMKWGYIILANIITGGYEGDIYPVNPKEKDIQGLKAYPDVCDVPGEVDLAMVVTPARTVPGVMRRCAKKGVRAAVVVPGGFSEEGGDGLKLEREVAKIAIEGGIRMVGPNTMGVFSGDLSMCAMMPPVRPLRGAISFVSQSGNLGTQLLGLGQMHEVGFSKFASSGNEAALFTEDYIEYFGGDPQAKVVLAYIEGLDHGREFLEIAKQVTRKKPLVVFKGGQTEAGSKAARSHCGAMAGKDAIYDAAFRQAGAIRASTPDEMLNLARALVSLPLPKGNRVGIISWGGGWGVVTADACEKAGLALPDLAPETLAAIDEVMPPYWSRGNPIDLVGTLDRMSHLKCLEALVRSGKIDAVIACGIVGTSSAFDSFKESFADSREEMDFFAAGYEKIDKEFERNIIRLIKEHGKPIVGVALSKIKRFRDLEEQPVVFSSPHRAVNVIVKMVEYRKHLDSLKEEV